MTKGGLAAALVLVGGVGAYLFSAGQEDPGQEPSAALRSDLGPVTVYKTPT